MTGNIQRNKNNYKGALGKGEKRSQAGTGGGSRWGKLLGGRWEGDGARGGGGGLRNSGSQHQALWQQSQV